jgi:hypothetical protein
MSKLEKERLNKMIEHALSYKQEINTIKSNYFYERLKCLILKQNVYGLTFASLIISCFIIPQILVSRNFVDLDEINDYVTLRVIEDL